MEVALRPGPPAHNTMVNSGTASAMVKVLLFGEKIQILVAINTLVSGGTVRGMVKVFLSLVIINIRVISRMINTMVKALAFM